MDEKFSDNSRGWWTGNDASTATSGLIENGKYKLHSGTDGWQTWKTFKELEGVDNYRITAEILREKNDGNGVYGLILGNPKRGNYFDFCSDGNGIFIRKFMDGKMNFVKSGDEPCPEWDVDDAMASVIGTPEGCGIYPGLFSNSFIIEKREDTLLFAIGWEGQWLYLKYDVLNKPIEPVIGFAAWKDVTIDVKEVDIRLWKPELTESNEEKTYKTVQIGTQIWRAENLNANRFANEETIEEAKSIEEWIKAGDEKKPAWCYYNFDSNNEKLYGKLYNWFAVADARGLAPQGWHVPSEEEWKLLIENLGGDELAGEKLKATSGWEFNGNNNSGFNALPGGSLFCYKKFAEINYIGEFSISGNLADWWGTSEMKWGTSAKNPVMAYDTKLYNLTNIDNKYLETRVSGEYTFKYCGYSVRCLKN